MSEKEANNQKKINQKICEVENKILDLLGLEIPSKSVGEKILEQFVSEFDQASSADQFRILTSMAKHSSREDLKKTFGVSEHKARRAKEIQTEFGLLSTPNP